MDTRRIEWTTVIQQQTTRDRWEYFSRQSHITGETPMTDAEYLKACASLFPGAFRIAPEVTK